MKVFSRPDQPGQEVIEGMRLLHQLHGIRPQDVTYFTHGTTVGVNTVIQRKGPRSCAVHHATTSKTCWKWRG